MSVERGPGYTQFIPNDDGSISVRHWNDPSWTNPLADRESLTGGLAASNIAHLLARAYQMGRNDQQEIIRSAIGCSK
jgi:hypothetical protein